jgi:flagellar biosynthetic protein FliR
VVLGTLVFLALDGHLALINTLVDSFRGLPIGASGFDAVRARAVADWGSILFLGGLRVALPGMTALLVINLAFGVMSRAAPALNLFAVGLPVTLVFGLAIVTFGMPTMGAAFTALLGDAFDFTRALTAAH